MQLEGRGRFHGVPPAIGTSVTKVSVFLFHVRASVFLISLSQEDHKSEDVSVYVFGTPLCVYVCQCTPGCLGAPRLKAHRQTDV